jgi:4-carboxymuconolactone decarboxylase
MTPRIPPIDNPDAEVAELLAKTVVRGGRPLNIFATLAHHPLLLKRYNALGGLFLRFGEIPSRDRELIILRVAWRSNSEYEFAQHSIMGREAGVVESELDRVSTESLDGWSDRDRELIAMVDEACRQGWLGERRWAQLTELWNTKQQLELVALVGFYRMTALILNSVEVEIEPGILDGESTTTREILAARFPARNSLTAPQTNES